MARRKKSRSRRKGLPHPSVTGLAGGLIVANYINQGNDSASTVTGALQSGDIDLALRRFMAYTPALVTSRKGQEALVKGIGVSVIGAGLRRTFKGVKLGTSKLYLTI